MQYEVIKASSPAEAMMMSKYIIGQTVEIASLECVANSGGTYSVFPVLGVCVPRPEPTPLEVFQYRIQKMNEVFQLESNETPSFLDYKRIWAFKHILAEEIEELIEIEESTHNEQQALVALADTLGDIVVYCFSEARRWGLPLDKILSIIMNSQESKLVNGKPLYNESKTKFIKGPHYVKPEPDIENMLFQDNRRQRVQNEAVAPITRPASAESIV